MRHWTEEFKRTLESPSPRMGFAELCDAGCLPFGSSGSARMRSTIVSIDQTHALRFGKDACARSAKKRSLKFI